MIVYLTADGGIQKVYPSTYSQGSNDEKIVLFGVNVSAYTAISVTAQLPVSNQVVALGAMTLIDNYAFGEDILSAYVLTLTTNITNFAGDLRLSFKLTDANSHIDTTRIVTVAVTETLEPTLPSVPATDWYNQILTAYAYITGKINTDIPADIAAVDARVDDIVDGTTVVKKAEQDQNGNNIVNTYQTKANLVTSFSSPLTDTKYPSEKLVKDTIDNAIATSSPLLTDIDLTKEDVAVVYDTTDGLTVSATGEVIDANSRVADVDVEFKVPVKAGDGVSMDANEEDTMLIVKGERVYITITAPENATNGTLTEEQLAKLSNELCGIKFNNELYDLQSSGHTAGFATYSMTEYESSEFTTKSITVTLSTGGWVLNTQNQQHLTVDSSLNTSSTNPIQNAPVANAITTINGRIDDLESIGRFLSYWNCATGLPVTSPETLPYTYKTGDYYIVGTVAGSGGTNYKPSGTSFTGSASTTIETDTIGVQYVYRFDGTNWAIGGGTVDLSGYVATFSQSFTSQQKAQARANIGAVDNYDLLSDTPIFNADLNTIPEPTYVSNMVYRHTGNTTANFTTNRLYLYHVTDGFKEVTVGGVTDVQVNGTSVTESGVAEIPKATTSNLGVVKPDGTTVTVDENGVLSSSGGVLGAGTINMTSTKGEGIYVKSVTFTNTPSSFDGRNIWTDGVHYYYSYQTNHYVLDEITLTWNPMTWNGLSNFNGMCVWRLGKRVFVAVSGSGYELDVATHTWSSNSLGKDGYYIWSDNTGNIYYSNGAYHYKLAQHPTTSAVRWDATEFTGVTNFEGANIWKTNSDTYLKNGANMYKLNGTQWVQTDVGASVVTYARDVWSNGDKIFYYCGKQFDAATQSFVNCKVYYNDNNQYSVIYSQSPYKIRNKYYITSNLGSVEVQFSAIKSSYASVDKDTTLYGTSAPTTTTIGSTGQEYVDTTNKKTYKCYGYVSGTGFDWQEIGGGSTYTAGDGITISANNDIAVKTGTGLFFDSNDNVALNNATQNALASISDKLNKSSLTLSGTTLTIDIS